MTRTIQQMTLEDFEPVLLLWQSTEGVGLSESDTKPNIRSFLKRNPGLSLVARNGGKIVGAVLCGHDGRRGYLHHLAVDKEHRRQGIGRKLVEACLKRLALLGIPKCNIFLFADNADGALFWKCNGWVSREDLHLLQKTLASTTRRSRQLNCRSC